MHKPTISQVDVLASCILIVLTVVIVATGICLSLPRAAPPPEPVVVIEQRDDGSVLGTPTLIGSDEEHHAVGSHPRSPHWPTFRARQMIKRGGRCEACGTDQDLNLHHVVPFSEDPSRELDADNVIILCRQHHLIIGHDRDGTGPKIPRWTDGNPNVRADAARMKAKLRP